MERIRYGDERAFKEEGLLPDQTCPDCGCMPGEFHAENCDQKECPKCGGQALSCGCRLDTVED